MDYHVLTCHYHSDDYGYGAIDFWYYKILDVKENKIKNLLITDRHKYNFNIDYHYTITEIKINDKIIEGRLRYCLLKVTYNYEEMIPKWLHLYKYFVVLNTLDNKDIFTHIAKYYIL